MASTQVWDILPWLCGVPAPERDRQLIMVMKAYIDDSGKDDPPVYVLAGFIARAEQWVGFTDEWADALSRASLSHFKMQDAWTFGGEFKGWPFAERDALLRKLAKIVRRHVLAAISARVAHDDYREVFEGQVTPFIDRAYLFLYWNVMYSAFQWQIDNNFNEPIDFVYDEQVYDADIVNLHFSPFLSTAPKPFRSRIGNRPVHADDKRVLPLQAADMYAWHLRRLFYERGRGKRLSTAALDTLSEIPHVSTPLSRDVLENANRQLHEFVRQDGKMFPYEVQQMLENVDAILSMANFERVRDGAPNSVIPVSAIPASGMRRFVLVHNCPRFHNPHLHRRAGDSCLAEYARDAVT